MKFIIALALAAAVASPAYAGPLPPLINFQSVLLDEGGNLLPSGPATVQFQILDENRESIYFENQTVDVVKGAVSALVGNGSNDQGITTGGIPEDIFATGATRYLQVQVGSQAPEEPMTIVSVPYAQWSQTSATVADGAVSSAKIATAAVGFEHLAPDVAGKLAAELSASHGILTTQSLASIGGATQVGVTAKFINSGSSSVQGVLQDIDLSVKKGQEQDQFLLSQLKDEVKNRTDAVDGVQKKLDQEVTDRTNAVQDVQGKLDQEVKDRSAADGGLQSQITPLQTTLSDINNLPGQLSLSKVNTANAAPTHLNMANHKIINLNPPSNDTEAANKNYVDVADGKLQGQVSTINTTIGTINTSVSTINTTISDINNISGILSKSKIEPDKVVTQVPPVLSGGIDNWDLNNAGANSSSKFIPFGDEVLAQSTCGNTSGHDCVAASILADSKLYHCKIGVKYNQSGHGELAPQNPYPTCTYTVIVKSSSIADSHGPNLDLALQRGIVVSFITLGNGNPFETIYYSVYEIPVATQ